MFKLSFIITPTHLSIKYIFLLFLWIMFSILFIFFWENFLAFLQSFYFLQNTLKKTLYNHLNDQMFLLFMIFEQYFWGIRKTSRMQNFPKMLLEQKIVFFCYKMKEKQIFVLFFRRIKNTKKFGVNHALAQCTQKKAIKVFYLKILEDFEFWFLLP